MLKRVKKKYKLKKSDKDENSDKDVSDIPDSSNFESSKLGIALEDYIQIFAVLIHIDDVDKVFMSPVSLVFHTIVTFSPTKKPTGNDNNKQCCSD